MTKTTMIFKCPGALKFRQPEPKVIECPSCSQEVEIWTDEVEATCANCKRKVMFHEGAICLEWCRYAKECVGEVSYARYWKNKITLDKKRKIMPDENVLQRV